MIQANLYKPETFLSQLTGPVWGKILTWLKEMPEDILLGEHTIQEREIYVNVQEAETTPRDKAVFEAHKKYIDMHFCISGGELIEYATSESLEPTTQYDAEKDFTLYKSPSKALSVEVSAGSFTVFFPNEAHMPKISDGKHSKIRKVVVKIEEKLLK